MNKKIVNIFILNNFNAKIFSYETVCVFNGHIFNMYLNIKRYAHNGRTCVSASVLIDFSREMNGC